VLEEAATVFKVNTFRFSFSIKNVTPVEPFLLDNINSARCIRIWGLKSLQFERSYVENVNYYSAWLCK